MWRLSGWRDEERGAVSIVVAILMVALLGFVALAIDVGLMYVEKAQQQNGADAAALAVAEDCADETGCVASASLALANAYANENANDGLTNIKDLAVDSTTVTVKTGAQEADGEENSISLLFANVLGFESAQIGAQATAAWGPPSAGPVALPLTFSECQFTVSGPQTIFYKGNNDLDDDDCHSGSGHAIPGGFGWLDLSEFDPDEDPCGVVVESEDPMVGSNPGNSMPASCTTLLAEWIADLEAGRTVTTLLPVFDNTNGTGNNGEFHISGFAAFNITGWKFSGGHSQPEAFNSTGLGGNDRAIRGEFVEMVSIDAAYELGGTDYDSSIVTLTLEAD